MAVAGRTVAERRPSKGRLTSHLRKRCAKIAEDMPSTAVARRCGARAAQIRRARGVELDVGWGWDAHTGRAWTSANHIARSPAHQRKRQRVPSMRPSIDNPFAIDAPKAATENQAAGVKRRPLIPARTWPGRRAGSPAAGHVPLPQSAVDRRCRTGTTTLITPKTWFGKSTTSNVRRSLAVCLRID